MIVSLGKGQATDGRLSGPLLWAIAALAIAFVPHIRYFPAWVSLAFAAAALLRLGIEHRRGHLVPPLVRRLVAIAAFLAVFGWYRGINGIGPGTALLAIMAAMKLTETSRRRDLLVLNFIALFLVLAALLREQTLFSLPYLVAALTAILGAWLNVSRFAGPLGLSRTLGPVGLAMAHALPLVVLFWVLFPRVPGPFWSVPKESGSGVTGISDTLSPGDLSQLTRNDAVAFRVNFSGRVPEPRELYWRGPVLTEFDGRRWTGSLSMKHGALEEIEARGRETRYTVALEPTGQRWLFALDMPRSWTGTRAFVGANHQLASWRPIDDRRTYDAVSYTDFRISEQLRPARRHAATRLPLAGNPRARNLARDLIREAGGDPRAFIASILGRFRSEPFFYTLNPPALGADSIDEFLFETRRGFCGHYASSFAYLARAAGIPARIVAGYHGGEINPLGGYLIVRQSDAHAWVEVWLDGAGWQRVDPTAAVSALRIESGLSAALDAIGERRAWWTLEGTALYQLEYAWDFVNARWDEWILGYGPETQQRFLRWLGMERPGWRNLVLLLTALTVVQLAIVAAVLARRYRPKRTDAAERIYRDILGRLGLGARPAASPGTLLAEAVQARPALSAPLNEFFALYQAARYAGDDCLDALKRRGLTLRRSLRAGPATAATPRE